MNVRITLLNRRFFLAPALVCALFAGTASADKHSVTVSQQIDTKGLDLDRPADAQVLYTRIRRAADDVCTRGKQVDLLPVENSKLCYEKALGDAIRSAGSPLLTQIYLGTHTLQEAAARGIKVPPELAAMH
jgi:UrcA family protein